MMVGINKSNKPYLLFQCVQSGTRYSDRENGPINRQNVSTSTALTLIVLSFYIQHCLLVHITERQEYTGSF